MPIAPPRVCSTCGHIDCKTHTRTAWTSSTPVQRIRGSKLQRLRAELFKRQPLCVLCMKEGRVTLATIRDHIIPLAEGGLDVPENTQAVCEPCNKAKAEQESARGKRRA